MLITIEIGDSYTIKDHKTKIKSILAMFTSSDSSTIKHNLESTNFPIHCEGDVQGRRRNGILRLYLDTKINPDELPIYADAVFHWIITDLIDISLFKSIPLKVTVGSYTDNTKTIFKTSTKSTWHI